MVESIGKHAESACHERNWTGNVPAYRQRPDPIFNVLELAAVITGLQFCNGWPTPQPLLAPSVVDSRAATKILINAGGELSGELQQLLSERKYLVLDMVRFVVCRSPRLMTAPVDKVDHAFVGWTLVIHVVRIKRGPQEARHDREEARTPRGRRVRFEMRKSEADCKQLSDFATTSSRNRTIGGHISAACKPLSVAGTRGYNGGTWE
jgi:hypothetical protein